MSLWSRSREMRGRTLAESLNIVQWKQIPGQGCSNLLNDKVVWRERDGQCLEHLDQWLMVARWCGSHLPRGEEVYWFQDRFETRSSIYSSLRVSKQNRLTEVEKGRWWPGNESHQPRTEPYCWSIDSVALRTGKILAWGRGYKPQYCLILINAQTTQICHTHDLASNPGYIVG